MSRPRRLTAPDPLPDDANASVLRWSAPLGSWGLGNGGSVPVRLHVSLAVVLVLGIGACWQLHDGAAWLAMASYVTSLLLHEAAHLAAVARSAGAGLRLGSATPIVLGPIGGLTTLGSMIDPRERVFCAMAGPVANLALVVGSMACLAMSGVELAGAMLIDPRLTFDAAALANASPLARLASLLIVVNWPLFLINMAPASPFDGGVALRSWLSVWIGRRPARDVTCFVSLLLAAGLIGASGALVLVDADSLLLSASLAVIAVLIAFGARGDVVVAEPAVDEWLESQGDDPIGIALGELPRGKRLGRRYDHAHPDLVSEEVHLGLEVDTEYNLSAIDDRWDEERVDGILAKVYMSGMSELTANERAILERASRLYQRRRDADE